MTTVSEELVTYLDRAGIGLNENENLFVDRMPDEPDTCIAVIPYTGEPPEYTHSDGTEISLEYPHVSIQVRGPLIDPSAASKMINRIYRQLPRIINTYLSGVHYVFVRPLHAPNKLNQDLNDRPLYSCSFRVCKEPSPE